MEDIMKLTLREINHFIRVINKRKNKEFQLQARLHGHDVPDLPSDSQSPAESDLSKEEEEKLDRFINDQKMNQLKEKAARIRNGRCG